MNPLLAIALLGFMRKGELFGSHAARRLHRRSSHRSGRPAVPAMPPMPPMPTHVAPEHAAPAEHAAASEAVHPAAHSASPAEHAAHEMTESTLHEPPAPERHVTVLPAPTIRHRRHKRHHVTTLPVQHITATVPDGVPVTTVASVQSILRGLGWTGDLTTKGPTQSTLTDGLFGHVTATDWEHSASKRGLDPTIVRINATTVHVHPDTFSALTQVARSKGAVVGIYIP